MHCLNLAQEKQLRVTLPFVSHLSHVTGLLARMTSPILTASSLTSVPLVPRGNYAPNCFLVIVITKRSCPWLSATVKNTMFVLPVAVLTISMDGSSQHVAKFSHPASAPSSAILFLEKLETDDSIPFVLK